MKMLKLFGLNLSVNPPNPVQWQLMCIEINRALAKNPLSSFQSSVLEVSSRFNKFIWQITSLSLATGAPEHN